MNRIVFPFSAVLGQERIKNALIWNFINPKIGGVLISGQKGTAKSTLIRSSEKISGRKIVELPLNITEDRLLGSVDFEYAIKHGKKKLEPGILAKADKNILYVDEINLLSDHVAKSLLEVAGEKICRIEREGISEKYASDFILIGSMNPEESGLRAQLLDRFGLYVEAVGEENKFIRCEIIRRRLSFEQNPYGFLEKYQKEEKSLLEQIQAAKDRLHKVTVSENAMLLAAQLAQSVNCQGSRGELALIETAKAICALSGKMAVNKEALTEAAKYALPHRMREIPESQEQNRDTDSQEQREDRTNEQEEQSENQNDQMDESKEQHEETRKEPQNEAEQDTTESEEQDGSTDSASDQGMSSFEKLDEIGEIFEVGRWLEEKCKARVQKGSGKRSLVKTDSLQGRYVKSGCGNKKQQDIAFDATLRAAAPYQNSREKNGLALAVRKQDIRMKIREKRTGNFIVFVVDASGSMGVGKRMSAVKGAIFSLLSDAYQKRDRVAMVTFRKNQAEIVLGMTRSVDLAAKKLEVMVTGGKTPLYAGLEIAHNLIRTVRQKEKDILPVLVLISDGRATAGKSPDPFQDAVMEGRAIAADHIKSVVIDVEQDFIKLKLAEKLAKEMDAKVYEISQLHAGAIISAVNLAIR